MGSDSAPRDQNLRANALRAPHCLPTCPTPHVARRALGRRGLVLGEALVLLALLIVVAMVLIVILGDSRRNAQMGHCQTNLRSYASSTGSYAADYEDLMWGFNWPAGYQSPLGTSTSTLDMHGLQAVWIMSERGPLNVGFVGSWVPHIMYSHLIAADYANRSLPDPLAVCPSDVNRYAWNRDPIGFSQGVYIPNPFFPSPPSITDMRWPFSSSYDFSTSFFDRSTVPSSRIRYASHSTFNVPSSVVLGQPRLTDVLYPSSKVHLSETHGFHHGTRQPWHEYPEARVNVVMVDGSVANRSASDSNFGWIPTNPAAQSGLATYSYGVPTRVQNQWYPGPLNGGFSDQISARFRWTRDGIKGRDFDGPEARTGQP